jgi:hypothetical protein
VSGDHKEPAIPDVEKSGVPRADRNNDVHGSIGGKPMHEAHREAAKRHELAAKSHRTAAEHNEKGDLTAAAWHSERAMEYSNHAYKLAKETQNKSGDIESL